MPQLQLSPLSLSLFPPLGVAYFCGNDRPSSLDHAFEGCWSRLHEKVGGQVDLFPRGIQSPSNSPPSFFSIEPSFLLLTCLSGPTATTTHAMTESSS